MQEIINAMKEVGCEPQNHNLIIDDRSHSYRVVGDNTNKATYNFKHISPTDVIGWFRNHRDGITHKYFTHKERKYYSPAEKAEFKKKIENERLFRQREIQRRHELSALKAVKIWTGTKRGGHVYLDNKGASGLGTHSHKNSLIVPAYKDGKISTLQFISPEGDKRFLYGGEIKGAYGSLGKDTSVIYISEGYATADSVYSVVKPCVSVWAFNAGNLRDVAVTMREKYPDAQIIICADNDQFTSGVNTGFVKSKESALAVNARIAFPDFSADDENKRTDFNDYLALNGKDMLLKRLEGAVNPDSFDCVVTSEDGLEPYHDTAPPSYFNEIPLSIYDEYNAPMVKDSPSDWQDDMICDGKGNPVKNSLKNTMLIVEHNDVFKGVFRYNDFLCDYMVVKCPPWEDFKTFKPHRLNDNDLTEASACVERFGLSPDRIRIHNAIKVVAKRNSFHPVQDYFDTLVWDGTPRLSKWLSYYLGAEKENADYLSFIGTNWMVAAVKRVYKAGCKFDHVLVLEGAQGAGKSTILKELATFGDEDKQESYFSDSIKINDLHNKDTIQRIQGSIIVEIAELAGFSKKDDEDIKSWITMQDDECRLPYERTSTKFPRQFVLAATTNSYDYLKDPTGNRRYWPLEVLSIDLESVKRDRIQLWAEAISLYKQGHDLWPKEEQIQLCEAEQAKRRSVDVWENSVLSAISNLSMFKQADGFETDEILREIGLTVKEMDYRAKVRVNNILKVLGYSQKSKRINEKIIKSWTKG